MAKAIICWAFLFSSSCFLLFLNSFTISSSLHDVGKINCYEQFENYIDITDTFLNQDHIINGTKIVSQEIQSEKLDDILHIIANHHQLKEWGSPVEPNSIEAWIIHFADNISAKIG